MISLKYTKNTDHFISNILPFLEIYFAEFPNEIIEISANKIICEILKLMFGVRIVARINKMEFYMVNENVIDLEIFLSNLYDPEKTRTHLTRPLLPKNDNKQIKFKNLICMYPKYKPSEMHDNITSEMMETFIKKFDIHQDRLVLVGDPIDRLTTKYGKDICIFNDVLNYLKECDLFIASDSYWVDIALICNCRNIVIYRSERTPPYTNLTNFNHANPFCCNVHIVHDICDDTIGKMLVRK